MRIREREKEIQGRREKKNEGEKKLRELYIEGRKGFEKEQLANFQIDNRRLFLVLTLQRKQWQN